MQMNVRFYTFNACRALCMHSPCTQRSPTETIGSTAGSRRTNAEERRCCKPTPVCVCPGWQLRLRPRRLQLKKRMTRANCQPESSDFTVAVSLQKAAVKAWSSVISLRPRRTLLQGRVCTVRRSALRILRAILSSPPLGCNRHV